MRLALMICIFIAVSGCASFRGTPIPAINVNETIKRYSGDLEGLAQNPPQDCDGVKDGINKALTIMDLRYVEFIDDISIENKTKATATDVMLVGLGLAGTAVGGAGAKTIFSAISSGVAATNTSIDKNFFYERTLPALVSKMNADRTQQQLLIIGRINNCEDRDYSWFEAVHDLTGYFSAGTLLGAIASISKDAGVKQVESESEIKAIMFGPSASTPDKATLRKIIKTPEGRAAILSCWKTVNPQLFKSQTSGARQPVSQCAANGPPTAPEMLIHVDACAGDQAKVLKCLE